MLPDPLHPALVHFPIVLVVLAPVVAAAALWTIRRGAVAVRAWAVPSLVLAALVASAWLATATGEREEDRVERVVPERAIETHEEAAEVFLYSAVVVLGIALVGLARGTAGRMGRTLGTAGSLVLVAVGWNVGRTGGELVYQHGAASAYTGSGGAPGAPARDGAGEGDGDEARRHVEEARAHYARIMPLIRNFHNAPAAAEMQAAADHLELAMRARTRLVRTAEPSGLGGIRETAALLARQETGVPRDTGPALEALRLLLDSLTPAAPSPDTVPGATRRS